MPKIPGIPTLDPVDKPMMSPGEAGKPGQAIAGLGQETNDIAQTGLDFDIFLKKAQEHVDSIAAQNQLAKVYADTQNQLAKTQNSRDVEGVIQQSNKNINDVSAEWSKSPAAVAIQMSADALRPDLSRIGTVKQVDLMGKEFKVTINTQSEILSAHYAEDRGGGGTGDLALGAFATAVAGGVKTGLVGDVEAQDMMRRFKQGGQELQIKNGITNANPEVNQKIYDEITQNKGAFPDVTQEQLDVMKGQALEAFEHHTKMKDWAEGQMAKSKWEQPLIALHTNPANGHFDEGAAMTDVADRYAKGEITATQADVLAAGFNAHATQLNVELRQTADKTKNSIVEMFHKNDYKGASAALEQHKNDPEFGEFYEGLTKYGDQVQRERRAEGREEYSLARQANAEESQETLGNLLSAMAQGHMFTDAQIYSMAGQGKGKMKSADAMEAIRATKAYQSDPNTQAAVSLLSNTFPIAKDADADTSSRTAKRQALTYQEWQKRVNENPTEDKVQAMNDVLKPVIQDHIAEQINEVFGVQSQKPVSLWERIKRADAGLRSGGNVDAVKKALNPLEVVGAARELFKTSDTVTAAPTKPSVEKSAPIIQHSSKTGAYRYSTDGGTTWQQGQPPTQ